MHSCSGKYTSGNKFGSEEIPPACALAAEERAAERQMKSGRHNYPTLLRRSIDLGACKQKTADSIGIARGLCECVRRVPDSLHAP